MMQLNAGTTKYIKLYHGGHVEIYDVKKSSLYRRNPTMAIREDNTEEKLYLITL